MVALDWIKEGRKEAGKLNSETYLERANSDTPKFALDQSWVQTAENTMAIAHRSLFVFRFGRHKETLPVGASRGSQCERKCERN